MEIRAEGFKVYLKSLSQEDADAIAENANDYEIARNVADAGKFPYPYAKADALNFIASAGQEHANGLGLHLTVRLVADGTLVGMCGLKSIEKDKSCCEIGYWIGRSYWGNKYGKEAARLMLAFAFQKLQMNRISATTFSYNVRSQKLLKDLGFQHEGTLRENAIQADGFVDDLVFGLLASEYKDAIKPEFKES